MAVALIFAGTALVSATPQSTTSAARNIEDAK
jgi:hypothetical protein